jgi:predicted DNA-binding transcriptional regulator AlpA
VDRERQDVLEWVAQGNTIEEPGGGGGIMNSTLLREVAKLWQSGFRPYEGVVAPEAYEALGCDTRRREPYWMCRWPILHCLGCAKRCTPQGTAGFQAVLPLPPPPQGRAGPDDAPHYSLTPEEMVSRKSLLRVDEVRYCLGISRTQAYRLAQEGVLVKHMREPWRVTAESVRAEMDRVDR